MMTGIRTRAGLLALAAATTMLAACGPSQPQSLPSAQTTTTAALPEPGDRLREAVENTLEADSFRLTSEATVAAVGGRQTTEVTFVGGDAQGTQHSTAPGYDSTVDFVRVGDSVYINTGELYYHWIFPLELLQYVVDRWVVFGADDPNHTALFVIEGAEDPWEVVGEVTQTGTDVVNDTPALIYEDANGNRFSVTAEGVPYLLRVEATQTTTEAGQVHVVVTFAEIGTVSATISVPPGPIFNPLTDFPDDATGHD